MTDYTWYLPDNYIVHVIIVAGKILLHGNILLLYLLHILLYWYPDHPVDIITVAITDVIPVIYLINYNMIIKKLILVLGKLIEEMSVFWVDIKYRLCNRKRVPLQGSRWVTDTLVLFLFLFLLYILYMLPDYLAVGTGVWAVVSVCMRLS